MVQLNNKQLNKSTPSGKPIKPKKPLPIHEESVKIPVPCSLTEERVREIVREEILKRTKLKLVDSGVLSND